MGVFNANKTVDTTEVRCGESFHVTLSFEAEPEIVSHPTDIVLVLDRSGSMAGAPLAHLKEGANTFIDIMDESTDGDRDGHIGGGSRIGVVSFASTATANTQLITSVADLKAAVDGLAAGGSTNHADAFARALQLFSTGSTNAKVIVLFTDGRTTAGPDATPIAVAARAQGVTIYCIGLDGSGGIDETALRAWASPPADEHVAITPDAAELEKLFEDLAKEISKPGATDVVIEERIAPCFRIVSTDKPTHGQVQLVDDGHLRWTIDELGAHRRESTSLTFTVEHVGPCTGKVPVNESVHYSDREGQTLTFPSPEIEVDCGEIVLPEPCPTPLDVTMRGCEDAVEVSAGDLPLDGLGRILQVDVTLKNVCPHKRMALAVIVTEVDEHGAEHRRGMKTLTVPAHERSTCQDVIVRCVSFVLPEDEEGTEPATSLCRTRNFKVRCMAHYIDNDFACCNLVF